MTEQHDYSPLQSLLVVQALAACSSSAQVFDDLSSQLSGSPLFNPDQSQNDARFTPDALKSLYLDLAKQEARREINGSRTSSRRKSPAPKSQKSDTEHHGKRAAELVPGLYEAYRAHVVGKIREEEHHFDSLSQQLDELRKAAEQSNQQSKRATENAAVDTQEKRTRSPFEQPTRDEDLKKKPPSTAAVPVNSIVNHEEPLAPRIASAARNSQTPRENQDTETTEPQKVPTIPSPPSSKAVLPQPQPAHVAGQSGVGVVNGHTTRVDKPALQPQDAAQYPHPPYNQPLPYQHAQHPPPAQYPPSTHSQPTPQQRGGIMLPPFQLSTQDVRQTATAKRVSDLNSAQQPPRSGSSTPQRRLEAASPLTPIAGPNGSHLRYPDVMVSPGSSTGWKATQQHMPQGQQVRGVSPLSEPEDLAPPSERKSTAKKPRRTKELAPTSQGRRRGPATRTVSPSVSTSSQADDSFRHPSALRKIEAADTPGSGDELLTPSAISRPKRGQGPRGRRRLSTTDTNASMEEEKPSFHDAASSQPTTVVVTRNLPKISKELLEQISSHKHGSMFNDPITNKVAEGYEDYIKIRQDLKSIKAMMQNGAKAIIAATAASDAPSSNSFRLPISEDLMPPQSIVNGAQLEQEIYRMFANSVMFNTGDSDYVDAAREMFADIGSRVRAWRDETEESSNAAAETEDDAPPATKKRRQG